MIRSSSRRHEEVTVEVAALQIAEDSLLEENETIGFEAYDYRQKDLYPLLRTWQAVYGEIYPLSMRKEQDAAAWHHQLLQTCPQPVLPILHLPIHYILQCHLHDLATRKRCCFPTRQPRCMRAHCYTAHG